MFLIIALVFVAVFLTVALLAITAGGAKQKRKELADRLESVTLASRRRPQEEGLNLLREEMLAEVPVIDRWIQRLDLFPKLRRIMVQAGMRWTPGGLLSRCLAVGFPVAVAVYWRTGVGLFSVVAGLVAATGPIWYVLFRRSQRFDAIEAKLPETLELMVRALRAGHGLLAAIELVAREMPDPVGSEFRKCFEEQNFGLEFREALLNLVERVPISDIRLIVTAVLIQKESGGNLAEILEKVAYVIRERFRLKRQVRVHTAQGRLTGWILASLPLLVGVGLYLIHPGHMSKLWTHPLGLKLMYTAAGMTVVGGLIIRKIVRIQI